MIKLAISGCMGKMGTRIRELALLDKEFVVSVLLEKAGQPAIGASICNLSVTSDFQEVRKADMLIEFTSPEATMEHLDACLKYKKAVVIGTTGLSEEQKGKLKEAAKTIPVLFSPNMSIGVNILFRLVKEAALKLPKDYATKIVEAHHIHKQDAPSGTALQIAQIIKEARNEEVNDIDSIREGEVIGDHKIFFESAFDSIELRHNAKSRDIFVAGALTAAKWLVGKKAGFYSMQDVLS